jgi:hypothetical protein
MRWARGRRGAAAETRSAAATSGQGCPSGVPFLSFCEGDVACACYLDSRASGPTRATACACRPSVFPPQFWEKPAEKVL